MWKSAKTAPLLLLAFLLISQAKASFFVEQGVHIAFHSQADLVMGADFTFNTDTITYGNGSINIGSVWLNSTCDMTLMAFFQDNWFNYTVTGSGTQQIFNGTKPYDVWIDGVDTTEFAGWTYSASLTTITTATSSVSILFGDWYSFIFADKDLDGSSVDSYVTWQLLNGSTVLDYDEGVGFLPSGTYTLKTYYLDSLINSTSLDTATYGNSTATIKLQMKPITTVANGYIAFNNTVSSLTINSQTSSNLTFTVTGSGNFAIVTAFPQNASYIQKGGVNQTGWVYDSSTSPDRIYWNTSSLSTYSIIYTVPSILDEGQYSFTWPDWSVILPNFSLTIATAFNMLAFLPIVAAVGFLLVMFYYRRLPGFLTIVELLVGMLILSITMYSMIPFIVAWFKALGI